MKKKGKIDNIYKEIKIDLKEFNELSNDEQVEKITETLNKMYEEKIEINKSYVLKCIKLTTSKSDDYLYLRENLTVEKNVKELIFSFRKQAKKLPIIILLVSTLLIGVFSATYSGLIYVETRYINYDINGDGVPDINLDLDDDRIPDINVDTDDDQLPDLNLDYKGNRENIFNVDTDDDGVADKNLVTDAVENPGECKVNCDTNGDGWPDMNFDMDADGTPDLDIDSDGDGIIDSSIDLNGDGLCDIMCDDDNDGTCDRNCIETNIDPNDPDNEDYVPSGPSDVEGDNSTDLDTARLSVVYEDFGELLVEGLVPTDQGGEPMMPEKKFSVTNLSDFNVIYKLTFVVETNTFESDNFMYKIDSNNGGFNADFVTAPWNETIISSYVEIGPLATQEYTVTFKLNGIGAPQDYDQGQKFEGFIKVGE